jgi:hypothetical protein
MKLFVSKNELSMIPKKELGLKSSKFLSFQLVSGAADATDVT